MQIAMERVASARGLNCCEVIVDDPPRVKMTSSLAFVTDVVDDDLMLSFDCDVAAWTPFCAPFDLDLRVAATDDDDDAPPRAIVATNLAGTSFPPIKLPL